MSFQFNIPTSPFSPGLIYVPGALAEAYASANQSSGNNATFSSPQLTGQLPTYGIYGGSSANTGNSSTSQTTSGSSTSSQTVQQNQTVQNQPFILGSSLNNGAFNFADAGGIPSFGTLQTPALSQGTNFNQSAALSAFQSIGQQANALSYQTTQMGINAIANAGNAGLTAANNMGNQIASNINSQSMMQEINLLLSGPTIAHGAFG